MLAVVFTAGVVYSFYKLFSGHGGSGLYDFVDAITYSSVVLFFASAAVLLTRIGQLKDQHGAILFLLIGLPLTITLANQEIENYRYDLPPDLTPPYSRPVSDREYLDDSRGVRIALDSFVVTLKRDEGRGEIQSAYVDTIVYSQTGDQIFVLFVLKMSYGRGTKLTSSAFYSDQRYETQWLLREASFRYSGDATDSSDLRTELRKFYFNQFRFADQDSLCDNFFWKKMKSDVQTIIVD